MIQQINLLDTVEAENLLKMQKLSYLVEAAIIDFYDIPPLKDTLISLQSCRETFFGYYLEHELVGAIAFQQVDDTIDICRLIVHPRHFRKGVAQSLLAFILSTEKITTITVSTGSLNKPALSLYNKAGFVQTGTLAIAEDISITNLKRKKG
ncbi:GNAT family N-acetyltransferase [Metabacillus herbersteinensis]|uniref:GNAT family N-acetyltransferase n=1 Tax=Metabacillus herbersteinensis TaxID=283816 RepID=A0ABV6GAQ5_9BACI